MPGFRITVVAVCTALIGIVGPVRAQDEALSDSLLVSDLVNAESTVDSLRLEIRRLDRQIQAMKQDYADGGEMGRLLAALADGGEVPDAAPEDVRSRRQRVDNLLKAITARPGQLRFNGGATVVAQDLVGGDTDGAAGTGSLDLYAHTSFGPSTLLFFAFEAGGGEGLDGLLPLTTPINGDAAPTPSGSGYEELALNEAWAEFTALDEAVILTAGKLDLTNYFDLNLVANDETAQFLSGAFVNSAALLVPPAGPGVRARTVLFRRFSVQGGFTSSDSTGGTRFQDGFAIGAAGMRLFPDSDYDGNLRGYVYAPAHVGGATGWGLSMDQEIAAAVTVFGRYGRNQEALVTTGGVQRAWSAGAEWSRQSRNRRFAVGAAYGEAQFGDEAFETTFEAYASWQLNTWTFLSPHLQVVRNDLSLPRAATAAGLRVQFNF